MHKFALVLLFVIALATYVAASDKVRLTDVQSLVFQPGRWTTSRRTSPVQQLQCVGGKCDYQPTSVMCKNEGHDGTDVVWSCTDPQMPSQYKFGPVSVNCEGYQDPDDPFILRGSCGLEFSIVANPNYQHPNRDPYYEAEYASEAQSGYGSYGSYDSRPAPRSSSSLGNALMLIVVVLIGLLICSKLNNQNSIGGGGGGGDGGYPPQNPLPHNAGSGSGSGSGSGWNNSYKPNYSAGAGAGAGSSAFPSSAHPNAASGPGFWSGMAGGGLLGYLFGRRNNYGPGAGYGYGYGSGFSGYGSGYGGHAYAAPPVYRPAAAPAYRPAAAPATAFATTRRR